MVTLDGMSEKRLGSPSERFTVVLVETTSLRLTTRLHVAPFETASCGTPIIFGSIVSGRRIDDEAGAPNKDREIANERANLVIIEAIVISPLLRTEVIYSTIYQLCS